ncbi:MAG: hypothetical protein V2A34_11215, partial [Lentisphaerota bacterium]
TTKEGLLYDVEQITGKPAFGFMKDLPEDRESPRAASLLATFIQKKEHFYAMLPPAELLPGVHQLISPYTGTDWEPTSVAQYLTTQRNIAANYQARALAPGNQQPRTDTSFRAFLSWFFRGMPPDH